MVSRGSRSRLRVPDDRHPAVGDGERLHPGAIAQPANTISALALVVAGAVPLEVTTGPAQQALRILLLANGIGSVGFHGPGDRGSKILHDVSLWAMIGLLGGGLARTAVSTPGRLRAAVPGLALFGAGAAVNAITRTGARWCRPDARLQGHALWHLTSAAAVRQLGRAVLPTR